MKNEGREEEGERQRQRERKGEIEENIKKKEVQRE